MRTKIQKWPEDRKLHLLESIKEVIPAGYDELLICGSRVGGWYHVQSDIDVLVLYPREIKGKLFAPYEHIKLEITLKSTFDYSSIWHRKWTLPKYDIINDEVIDWNSDDIYNYLNERKPNRIIEQGD